MADEDPSSTAPETSMITNKASIESYNRGPITKYWEPAPSCSNTMSLDNNMYYGWGAAGVVDTACYPMGTMEYKDIQPASSWDLYYYSPAICPSDWTRVTTFADGGIPHKNELTSISVGTDTTAMLCCPSGFSYSTEGHVCTSTINQNQVLKYVIPKNDDFGTLDLGPVKTSTYPTASHAYANGIVIMFQSSDTAMLRTVTINPTQSVASTANRSGSTSTGTTPPTESTSNTLGTTTSTADAQPALRPEGLSTGAKVGMGVGIPCALLLGLLVGWFAFRRRRSSGLTRPPGYDEAGMVKYAQVHEAHSEPPEMGGNERLDSAPSDVKVAAAQVHQRHELQ